MPENNFDIATKIIIPILKRLPIPIICIIFIIIIRSTIFIFQDILPSDDLTVFIEISIQIMLGFSAVAYLFIKGIVKNKVIKQWIIRNFMPIEKTYSDVLNYFSSKIINPKVNCYPKGDPRRLRSYTHGVSGIEKCPREYCRFKTNVELYFFNSLKKKPLGFQYHLVSIKYNLLDQVTKWGSLYSWSVNDIEIIFNHNLENANNAEIEEKNGFRTGWFVLRTRNIFNKTWLVMVNFLPDKRNGRVTGVFDEDNDNFESNAVKYTYHPNNYKSSSAGIFITD